MWFTYFGNWARQSNLTNHIVSFILESTTSKMATIEEAFDVVCKTFRISALNAAQKNGITKIVEEKRDVFINLPTGFGKSLLYQALPLVFDLTSNQPGHIVVIVSPLISLMDDQVSYLSELGLKACNITSLEDGERTRVVNGEYSLIFRRTLVKNKCINNLAS